MWDIYKTTHFNHSEFW